VKAWAGFNWRGERRSRLEFMKSLDQLVFTDF